MKRTEKQIDEFIELLAKLWKSYPAASFGQLLYQQTRLSRNSDIKKIKDIFYIKDNEFIEDLTKSINANNYY